MAGPLGDGSRVKATRTTRVLRLALHFSIKAVVLVALFAAAAALNPQAPSWAVLIHSVITWALAVSPLHGELRRRRESTRPRRQAEESDSGESSAT